MKATCWLGSLHYGNYISYEQLLPIYSLLESHGFDIYVDTSFMYGSGKSLDILRSLCSSFPSIKISVKYGLTPRVDQSGRWGVEICSNSDLSLSSTIHHYLEYLPSDNLYSFQFHALNPSLLCNWLSQLTHFPFFKSYGVSNMSLPEANLVRNIAKNLNLDFSFSQIHANIIEQKILNEFLSDSNWTSLICNRSLARGFLSDRFINQTLSSDSRILHSERVINSLTLNHKQFLYKLSGIASSHYISLSQLSYIFLVFSNRLVDISPIISPKSLLDLKEFIQIFNFSTDRILSLMSVLQHLFLSESDLLNSQPLFYLEK